MALTFTPSAQDLVSVLGELEERTHPTLGPWCRPADAEAVRRAIIDRTDDLRKLLNQAVRLIRVAALASARDYTQFLYLDVPALRPRFFKAAVETAARSGRLSGRVIAIDEAGVRLREPAMALSREPASALRGYELSYAQMPRSAILLDVLHNTLGYRLVTEVAEGIVARKPATASAAQVTQDLRSRFNAWLAPRLESAHRRQQAKVLHAFLASRDALSPPAINDEVVFAFWRSRAQAWREEIEVARKQTAPAPALASVEKAARDEGFRVFRTAAKSLLRYRQALADAAHADALERQTSIPVGEATLPLATASPWQSPLVLLARPPADRVKWLTETEYRWLTNYLGRRPVSAGDDDGSGEQEPGAPEAPSGLMEGRPYDLALFRTLLRVDTFAPIQASLIAGLKKRRDVADLLARALTRAERMTYHDAVQAYAELKDKLELEALAALNALSEAGEPMALLLIQHFAPEARAALDRAADELPPHRPAALSANGPGQGRRSTQEEDHEEADDLGEEPERLGRLGRVIRNAFCSEPRCGILGALISRSAAARKKIARTGFKPHEVESLEGRRALAEAVPSIIALAGQLARLIERLKVLNPENAGAEDGQKFADVLRLIYWTPEETAPQ